MLDKFCDQCGERRIGQFRYCLKCGSDFERWRNDAAAPGEAPLAGILDAPKEPDVPQTTVSDHVPGRASPGERHFEPGASFGGGWRRPVAEALTAITIGVIALLIVFLAAISVQPPA